MAKINLNPLIRTLTGKNKTGQVIYGILDLAPIPPIHNLIRMAISEDVPKAQIPSYVWGKLDKLRLSTSMIALALSFAVVKGWLKMEDVQALIEVLGYLMK